MSHRALSAAPAALLLVCCVAQSSSEADVTRAAENSGLAWPTVAWPTSTPEAEGIDGAALAEVDAALRAGDYGYADALLVIRHGRLVADYR